MTRTYKDHPIARKHAQRYTTAKRRLELAIARENQRYEQDEIYDLLTRRQHNPDYLQSWDYVN